MVTKIEFESETLVLDIIKEIKDDYEREWEADDILHFKSDGKKIGKMTLKEKSLSITGKALEEALAPIIKLIEKAKNISEAASKKLIFKSEQESNFYSLYENKLLTKTIHSELVACGVKALEFDKSLERLPQTVFKKVSILINPRIDSSLGTSNSGLIELVKNLKDSYDGVKEVSGVNTDVYIMSPLAEEHPVDIKLRNIVVGRYYPMRNAVHLFFNPFNTVTFHSFKNDIPPMLVELFDELKRVGIAEFDTTSIAEKLFITAFMEKAKEKLRRNSDSIKSLKRDINDYEKNIRLKFEDMLDKETENKFIQENVDNNGVRLFDELQKTKTLPFIQEVSYEGDEVIMVFKPTHVSVNNFDRNGSKGFGKRTMWVGEITFKISPKSFKAFGDCPTLSDGNMHPHGSGNEGGVCMGDGEGKLKIYELLHACNFSELAKMLWFWIKTYRNSGAYVKQWDWYDDRLAQGYPVWDEKGERIDINESARLESGEQVDLTEASNYAENIKKYAKINM